MIIVNPVFEPKPVLFRCPAEAFRHERQNRRRPVVLQKQHMRFARVLFADEAAAADVRLDQPFFLQLIDRRRDSRLADLVLRHQLADGREGLSVLHGGNAPAQLQIELIAFTRLYHAVPRVYCIGIRYIAVKKNRAIAIVLIFDTF